MQLFIPFQMLFFPMQYLGKMLFFPIQQLLPLTVVFDKYKDYLVSLVGDALKNIRKIFSTNIYVFLEDYSTPFLSECVNTEAACAAPVKFAYNPRTRLFFNHKQTSAEWSRPLNLPILSLVLIDSKSITLHDLTDHVAKVQYINVPCPTISEVVMVWMINSRIILDRNNTKVRYTKIDGLDETVDIDYSENLLDHYKTT